MEGIGKTSFPLPRTIISRVKYRKVSFADRRGGCISRSPNVEQLLRIFAYRRCSEVGLPDMRGYLGFDRPELFRTHSPIRSRIVGHASNSYSDSRSASEILAAGRRLSPRASEVSRLICVFEVMDTRKVDLGAEASATVFKC